MITLSFFLLSKFWVVAGFATLIVVFLVVIAGYIGNHREGGSLIGRIAVHTMLTLFMGLYLFAVTALFEAGAMSSGWTMLTETYTEYKAGEEQKKIEKGTAQKIYLPTKVEQFTVVTFNPPKHVYVGLKHIASGQVFENQYVSKHCSNRPTLHETINIQVTPFYFEGRPDNLQWEFNNLSKEICS